MYVCVCVCVWLCNHCVLEAVFVSIQFNSLQHCQCVGGGEGLSLQQCTA